MTTQTLTQLKLDKAILLVNNDKKACISASRIAEFHGLFLQVANSVSSALSFLDHKPRDYFLVIVDEEIESPEEYSFIDLVARRWPHINRVAVCDREIAGKGSGLEVFKRLSKPVSDQEFSRLLYLAKEDFLARNTCLQTIIDDRLAVLRDGIETVLSDNEYKDQLVDFSFEYFSACKKAWRQSGRYTNDVFTQDSEQFQQFLYHRILEAVKKVCSRAGEFIPGRHFQLSNLLSQFGINSDNVIDRYIEADEAGIVAMFSILKDYYSILGYDMGSVVYPKSKSIKFELGGRFTYNDLFNPLLSSVQKGVELACLKLEFFMLARISKLDVEISYDESYSMSLVC